VLNFELLKKANNKQIQENFYSVMLDVLNEQT